MYEAFIIYCVTFPFNARSLGSLPTGSLPFLYSGLRSTFWQVTQKVFDDDSAAAFVDVGRAFDASLRDAFPDKPTIIREANVQDPVMIENGD